MSVVFSPQESALLDRIAIDDALSVLPAIDRVVICCSTGYGDVPDGESNWPMSHRDIARYIAAVDPSGPASKTAVQRTISSIHARWATIYMPTISDFDALCARYVPFVRILATSMSDGDSDALEDLKQEGLIALWKVDPRRQSDEGYVKACIRNAMKDWIRLERRRSGEMYRIMSDGCTTKRARRLIDEAHDDVRATQMERDDLAIAKQRWGGGQQPRNVERSHRVVKTSRRAFE
jgi:RNA polymerase sigma factor (sigma-70 family)